MFLAVNERKVIRGLQMTMASSAAAAAGDGDDSIFEAVVAWRQNNSPATALDADDGLIPLAAPTGINVNSTWLSVGPTRQLPIIYNHMEQLVTRVS